jgi:hypothetical protein
MRPAALSAPAGRAMRSNGKMAQQQKDSCALRHNPGAGLSSLSVDPRVGAVY